MSKPTETLFEMDTDNKKVYVLGIELNIVLDESVKVLINDVEVNKPMKISSLKIVKEY